MYLCQFARKNKFSFPKGFEDKTYAWLQRHYNGIGAEWMPSYLRSFITKAMRHMEAAALLHDIEFLNPKKSFWNFTKANARLFWNGIRARHILSGLIFALVCQCFGWSAWKEGKVTMAYYYHYKETTK